MRAYLRKTTSKASRKLRLEALESRTLLSTCTSCSLDEGMLVVDFDPTASDTVALVRNVAQDSIAVAINGNVTNYSAADVMGIELNGATRGDDTVLVDPKLNLPMYLDGRLLNASNSSEHPHEARLPRCKSSRTVHRRSSMRCTRRTIPDSSRAWPPGITAKRATAPTTTAHRATEITRRCCWMAVMAMYPPR